jgi:CheY-like chemotaxis protein
MIRTIRKYLSMLFHTLSTSSGCCATGSGEEAMQLLLSGQFIPDIIFTDINMPGMNGFAFIRSIRKIAHYAKIPIIVYSGEYSEKTITEGRIAGAQAIYAKHTPRCFGKYNGEIQRRR